MTEPTLQFHLSVGNQNPTPATDHHGDAVDEALRDIKPILVSRHKMATCLSSLQHGLKKGVIPNVMTHKFNPVLGDLPEDLATVSELDDAKTKAWTEEAKAYSAVLEPAIAGYSRKIESIYKKALTNIPGEDEAAKASKAKLTALVGKHLDEFKTKLEAYEKTLDQPLPAHPPSYRGRGRGYGSRLGVSARHLKPYGRPQRK